MDVDRLKKGHMFTEEYFDRQLETIREIRLSERKFYQKVTDLYAIAFDYNTAASATKAFFALVKNKMHWAVHRHAADGKEFWPSRELARVLDYTDYRNFEQVVVKAKQGSFKSGQRIEDHFVDVTEMNDLPKGAQRAIAVTYLSRYSCADPANVLARRPANMQSETHGFVSS